MNTKIKCGNCKASHETVEEVRACYGGALKLSERPASPSETEPVWSASTPRGGQRSLWDVKPVADTSARSSVPSFLAQTEPATTRQIDFLNNLLNDRPMYRDVENLWPENVAKLSKSDASRKIAETLKVPAETTSKGRGTELNNLLSGIADCYVALPSRTGNNDLDFIRVATNQGRENPANKGNRRVQRILGGHSPIQMKVPEAIEYAEIISKMSESERWAAMVLFGQEIGRCGHCGRSLTDETSRAAGIGPICITK